MQHQLNKMQKEVQHEKSHEKSLDNKFNSMSRDIKNIKDEEKSLRKMTNELDHKEKFLEDHDRMNKDKIYDIEHQFLMDQHESHKERHGGDEVITPMKPLITRFEPMGQQNNPLKSFFDDIFSGLKRDVDADRASKHLP